MKNSLLPVIFLIFLNSAAQHLPGPLPNKYQLAWHEKEFYLFLHFGPNSFTDREWGTGTEPAAVFNPRQLDCRQWTRVAKESGATGIIITAKHHDGFCLWPSKYSKHTVRESKWKQGKGDVLKELSAACKEAGLKFGVYISPWDRNHPDYGTSRYNDVFTGMIKEVLTKYGPVWEMWWDGANGEGPNGKMQVYDWRRYEKTVRSISPSTVIFSDIGPDIRWVGNEQGIAGDPNWNFLDTTGFKRGLGAPPNDTLNHGNYFGRHWLSAECDVSIRPGWFWHGNEDSQVKSAEQLFNLYLKSVGRGANFLLNVPPDSNGLIRETDINSLNGFKKIRDSSFSINLMGMTNVFIKYNPKGFIVDLGQEKKVNCIILKEAIHLGQTVRKFKIILFNKTIKTGEVYGTSVGRKRILTFPIETITSFQVVLEETTGPGNITATGVYLIDASLVEN